MGETVQSRREYGFKKWLNHNEECYPSEGWKTDYENECKSFNNYSASVQ